MLITHDLGVIAEMADYVVVMYAGRIVEKGTAEDIFYHPAHPYTEGLFGSLPSMNTDADRLKPINGMPPDPTNLPEGCAFAPRCRYAMPVCKKAPPTEVDGSACWLMDRRAPSVTLSGGITC